MRARRSDPWQGRTGNSNSNSNSKDKTKCFPRTPFRTHACSTVGSLVWTHANHLSLGGGLFKLHPVESLSGRMRVRRWNSCHGTLCGRVRVLRLYPWHGRMSHLSWNPFQNACVVEGGIPAMEPFCGRMRVRRWDPWHGRTSRLSVLEGLFKLHPVESVSGRMRVRRRNTCHGARLRTHACSTVGSLAWTRVTPFRLGGELVKWHPVESFSGRMPLRR
jgi:hypothetical protein